MQKIKWLALVGVLALAGVLLGATVLPALAQGGVPWQRQDNGYGYGMMGWHNGNRAPFQYDRGTNGNAPTPYNNWHNPNMMGGQPGAYCSGMGSGAPYLDNAPAGEPITMQEAIEIAEQATQEFGSDYQLAEVMQFEVNFYAQIVERESGIGVQEILIDPYSGAVRPEQGPNMMWNTEFGHMNYGRNMHDWNQQPAGEMTVTPQQAAQLAQTYLDQYQPGTLLGDELTQFYGYYTLHTLQDGQIAGMLSVNGYSGQVWYHHWHGAFIAMEHGE